ncbi:MAG: hypothetical protein ABGW69_00545 [Nanoarchaeota archaeon]
MESKFVKVIIINKEGYVVKKIFLKKRSDKSPYFKELKNQLGELKNYLKNKNYSVLVREYEPIEGNRLLPVWKEIKDVKELKNKLILV